MESNERKALTAAVLKGKRLEGRDQDVSDPWRRMAGQPGGFLLSWYTLSQNASIVLPALGPFSFLYLRTVQTYKTYSLFAQKPKGDEQGYPSGLIGKIQTDQKPNAIWLTSGRSSNWIKLPLNMISLGLLKPGTKTYVRVSCYTNGCTELQPRPQGLISWRLFLSLYCPAENWLSYLWALGANGMAPQNTTVTDWSELLGIYGLIITRRKKKGPWGRQQGTGKL